MLLPLNSRGGAVLWDSSSQPKGQFLFAAVPLGGQKPPKQEWSLLFVPGDQPKTWRLNVPKPG